MGSNVFNRLFSLLGGGRATLRHLRALFSLLIKLKVSLRWTFASILSDLAGGVCGYIKIFLMLPLLRSLILEDHNHLKKTWIIKYTEKVLPSLLEHLPPVGLTLGAFVLVSVLQIWFEFKGAELMNIQAKQANSQIRSELFSRYLSFNKSFFDKTHLSKLNEILLKNTQSISNQFVSLHHLLTELLRMANFGIAMVLISIKMTAIVIVVSALCTLLTAYCMRNLRTRAENSKCQESEVNRSLFTSLVYLPIIRLFSTEKKEISTFNELSNKQLMAANELTGLTLRETALSELGVLLSMLSMAMYMILLVPAKSPSEASVYLLFFFLVRNIGLGIGALERFKTQILATTKSLTEMLEITGEASNSYLTPSGSALLMDEPMEFEFKEVDFSFKGGNKILNRLSTKVPGGSIVCITGKSGCGKTTLSQLLLRYYDPTSGSIFLGGRPIQEYDLTSLRKVIGYVPQESLFFPESIFNNLVYGLEDPPSLKEIEEACSRAQILQVIQRLDQGFQTHIGDQGAHLSGGEKQRLALARAFLRNQPFLILDESTSALDFDTEKKIVEELRTYLKGRTAIIISHRPALISLATHLLTFKDGQIIFSSIDPRLAA